MRQRDHSTTVESRLDPCQASSFAARVATAALAALLVAAATMVLGAEGARAHAPHDDVSDIEVSPDFADDETALAIVRGKLMRSTDRGENWSEVVRGLGREQQVLSRVAYAPSDARIVYMTSRTDGVLRSVDGGTTWQAANGRPGGGRTEVAVSPVSPETALVAGGLRGGLFRTTDGASSWSPVGAFGHVTSVAFLPDGSRALAGNSRGQLFASDDEGASWQLTPTAAEGAVTALAAGTEGLVFMGTRTGQIFRSTDAGRSFDRVENEGLPAEQLMSLQLSPSYADDQELWASTRDSGVFRSTDAGETWEDMSDGLTTDHQADEVDVPQFRGLATGEDSAGNLSLFVGGFDGLFSYDDEHGAWHPVETLDDHIVGLAVSPDYATDGSVVITTYVKGAFVSDDRGETWHFANAGITVDGHGSGNKFAPLRRLHNAVFSPDYATDGTMFSASWIGVLRSTDRGASWEEIPVGESPDDSPLRQYVLAVSPTYTDDQTIFAATRHGQVYRSEGGGARDTWQEVGHLDGRVRSLAVSPAYTTDGVLYAGTVEGVFTSADRGATWRATGPRIEQEPTGSETDAAATVAMSPDYSADGTVFAGTDHGLFVTRDGGASWTVVTAGLLTGDSEIEAVSVSPAFQDDATVLISTTNDGLLRSTDGGNAFEPVGTELVEANLLVADFSNPTSAPIQFSPTFPEDRTVYAYAQTELVRSTDGGDTWNVVDVPDGSEVLASLGLDTGHGVATGPGSDKRWFETPIGNLSVRRVAVAVAAGVVVGVALLALGMRRTGRRRGLLLAGTGSVAVLVVALFALAG